MKAANQSKNADARPGTSEFRWVEEHGERRIYDGHTLVAAFYEGADGDRNEDYPFWPICFHDARLSPDGPVAFARGRFAGPICLSWRKHFICNMGLDSLEIDVEDPACFKLFAEMRDRPAVFDDVERRRLERNGYDLRGAEQGGRLVERCWLELTYDEERGSYVFDIRTEARPEPGWEDWLDNLNPRGVEFADLLPADCNDRFPPNGRKRYRYFFFQGEDGRTMYQPMNHRIGPEKKDIHFAPEGFQMFGVESDVNPMIQFLDGHGADLHTELCWAMYDVHFKFKPEVQRERLQAGEPLRMHYVILGLDGDRARAIADEAILDPRMDDPMVDTPLYLPDGVQHFEPSDAHLRPTDAFSWLKSDPACVWDRETGYETPGSLSVQRVEASQAPLASNFGVPHDLRTDGREQSQWEAMLGWRGRLTGAWRVSVMVRTENLRGAVKIGWQFLDGPEGARPVELSEPITRDTDWVPLELITSDPGQPSRAIICLMLEGEGRCWFDVFAVEPVEG